MKINSDYVLRNILDETLIVPTGEMAQYFNGMISTNEVAGFIWRNLESCDTADEIVDRILDVFDVDRETASKDVEEFLYTLKEAKMIE